MFSLRAEHNSLVIYVIEFSRYCSGMVDAGPASFNLWLWLRKGTEANNRFDFYHHFAVVLEEKENANHKIHCRCLSVEFIILLT